MQYNFSTPHRSYKYMHFNNIFEGGFLLLLTNRNPHGRQDTLLAVKQVASMRTIITASQLRTVSLADTR
jgi:hypothetical protein